MKRLLRMIPLAVFLSLLVSPLFARPMRDSGSAGKNYELVLLHTNDHHGAILPNNGQGGLAEVASFVKQVRSENPFVLLVDAGDINTGPALSNMFAAEPDFLAYNMMGYDAATMGNHEFDKTQEQLLKQIDLANFPFFSSNIKTSDGKFLGGRQYLIKNYGGLRVGLFGITTLRTLTIASPDRSLVWIDEIEAARAAVDALRQEKADLIIALTHMGDVKEGPDHTTSLELAAAVPGIDIIIDGHSHSFFEAPKKAGNAYIVSANEWGKYVGYGKITVKDGALVNFDWKPEQINTAESQSYKPNAALSALLAPYIEKAQASLTEVVGEATEEFVFGNRLTRYQETALGNMITDSNVWYFKTELGQDIDFAFHNGGNIRAALPQGPITREQILTILPFENYLYIVSLKGSDLIEMFNFIATIQQGAGGFPQFSGEVRYTIDKTEGEGVIKDLSIGGRPVDPDKLYRFCTNDYLLGGGDGYEILTKSENPFNTSLLLSYVVIEYINARGGSISPVLDGRLTVIGGLTP
ncbi:MAG: 5'-nucleotidase C-terminal domain-containing protein [Treponema sp.]|jgi:5'-nucleotidase/UDP-sugar diphosphatase|nr:5'-nucleotidase C-terminal domain-containing protein [Treponema sp.]